MDNSDFTNIQKSLYNNILPSEILKAVCGKGLGGYMTDLTQQRNEQIIAPLDCAQDSARQLGSGAEHTSQTAKELLEEGNNNKINYNIHRASGRETTHKCFAHPALLQPIPRKRCCGSAAGIRLEIFKQRNENLPYRKLDF